MESNYTNEEVLSIAKRQRNLLLVFMLYLLAIGIKLSVKNSEYEAILQFAVIPFGLAVVVFCAILAFKVFNKVTAVICTILCFIPLLNLITFFVVNSKASKAIESQGFRVGLAGGDIKEIQSRI